MSLERLDRLEACNTALIGALDADDVAAIEVAAAELLNAVQAVKAHAPGWRDVPGARERARSLFEQTEAARIRVNFLTDRNRRRLAAVQALRGEAPAIYGRTGA